MDFDTWKVFCDFAAELGEFVDSSGGEDETEVVWRCAGKFDGGARSDARGRAGDKDCLSREAFFHGGHCGGETRIA